VALRNGRRHSRRSKDESGVRQLSVLSPSEVDGWRSPQKPEGPSGRRCADWTRRKELFFPDAGIVVRDRVIPPDTRLAGRTPCFETRARRDQHLALDSRALIRGFRALALCDGGRRGRRPKASQEETAGRVGTVWQARLWGFEDRGRRASEAAAAGGARCFGRKRRLRTFSIATMRGSEAPRGRNRLHRKSSCLGDVRELPVGATSTGSDGAGALGERRAVEFQTSAGGANA